MLGDWIKIDIYVASSIFWFHFDSTGPSWEYLSKSFCNEDETRFIGNGGMFRLLSLLFWDFFFYFPLLSFLMGGES